MRREAGTPATSSLAGSDFLEGTGGQVNGRIDVFLGVGT